MRLRSVIVMVLALLMFVMAALFYLTFPKEPSVEARRFGADSARAVRDTTRTVALDGVLTDSVRVYQRRVVQVGQVRDSLDRALKLERAARYRIAAEVTELRSRLAAPVTGSGADGDEVRSARFGVREAPYHIDAAVTLPRPPGDGVMSLRVALDTAVFEGRIGCGDPDANGVRPATLTMVGPRWVNLRLERLEQDPRVCSVEPREQETRLARLARRIRVGAGYGAVIAPDGRVIRGPSVAVTWSLWP